VSPLGRALSALTEADAAAKVPATTDTDTEYAPSDEGSESSDSEDSEGSVDSGDDEVVRGVVPAGLDVAVILEKKDKWKKLAATREERIAALEAEVREITARAEAAEAQAKLCTGCKTQMAA
jgi:hypothetical protein